MTKARASKTTASAYHRELFHLIAELKNEREAETLLKDLLTPQELDSLAERWQEIQLIASGMPQRDVAKKLGISMSKVTRGSLALQFGTGGFAMMLKRMGKRRKNKTRM